MAAELPRYYFRTRENGAIVFRVDQETRTRRLDMEQIAAVNIRSGEVKPHGARTLTADDNDAIEGWMTERRRVLSERMMDDIRRTVDHLNQVAHWIQSTAEDHEVDAVTDELLLSMHDLRSVLVRKRAERVQSTRSG